MIRYFSFLHQLKRLGTKGQILRRCYVTQNAEVSVRIIEAKKETPKILNYEDEQDIEEEQERQEEDPIYLDWKRRILRAEYNEETKRSIQWYCEKIRELGQKDRMKDIYAIARVIVEQKVYPLTVQFFNLVMHEATKKGQTHKGIKPNATSYACIYDAFSRSPVVEEFVKLRYINGSPEIDEKKKSLVVSVRKYRCKVISLHNKYMEQVQPEITDYYINSLLKFFSRIGDLHLMLQVANINDFARTLNPLDTELASKEETGVVPLDRKYIDVVSLTILMQASLNLPEGSFELTEKIMNFSFSVLDKYPPVELLNVYLLACMKEVRKLKKSAKPDIIKKEEIDMYFMKGMNELKKQVWVDVMTEPDLLTHQRVLDLCKESGKFEFAVDYAFYNILSNNMVFMDDILCSTLATVFFQLEDPLSAVELFDLYLKTKISLKNREAIKSESLNVYFEAIEYTKSYDRTLLGVKSYEPLDKFMSAGNIKYYNRLIFSQK
ncbi:hypothetical protein O9G_000276 [Rozella allomycis CSF55]|uniref:Uncharacterized protein n=1 Tax=Rozella allomycis (strain CSF55) TaxID=988480 RepID=A0A075ATD7_ROZAC|nr:hypothetical protein O9G_000276 [Rozella allomycis CSF55]|eukprot:EPZ31797.1 hypothetical protein O9G_000276 [Rozella allomycis CSF55]